MAQLFVCSKTDPIVQTKAGKIRGFVVNGTYTFHGIKYADAKRFQMPTEVEPWEGVKDALGYGYVCPMLTQDNPSNELMVPHRYWPMDENCQYLNIWTQTLCKDAKKPVMVWFHGGGFAAGSSIEQVAYEGDNMSRLGDCVVVTLNHRLNILGYMDLSPFGEKYKNSGNAGNGDMVAALKWVHDNIAAFGGDPDNVTIFGQSGGGMKVTCMLQTPAADGLFHRGVVQSGVAKLSSVPMLESGSGDGTMIVNAMMKELGFDNVEQLETVPYARLAEAYKKVSPAIAAQGGYIGGNPIPDDFYMGDPFVVGFTEHAKTVPVMVGTAMCEFAFGPGVEDKNDIEGITAQIKAKYGDRYQELIDLYKKAYPGKNLSYLLFADTVFRQASQEYVELRAETCSAPTYSYMLTFEFPIDGGKPAWHCSEIPFVFHNSERVPVCNLPGVSDELENQIFGAWMNFSRSGNPGHAGLPQWDACKPGEETTMLFDVDCAARKNFDKEFVDLLMEIAPPFVFGAVKVEH